MTTPPLSWLLLLLPVLIISAYVRQFVLFKTCFQCQATCAFGITCILTLTDRQTDTHTPRQTRVTTIHFSWSSTHAKCNNSAAAAADARVGCVFDASASIIICSFTNYNYFQRRELQQSQRRFTVALLPAILHLL